MPFCRECGFEVQAGWKFCPQCNRELSTEKVVIQDGIVAGDVTINNLDQIKQAINDFYQEKDESSNEDFAQEENLQAERILETFENFDTEHNFIDLNTREKLAGISFRSGDLIKAEKHYSILLEEANSSSLVDKKISALRGLAKCYKKTSIYHKALNSLHQALNLSKDNPRIQRWTLRDIVDIHIKRDEIDEAKLFVKQMEDLENIDDDDLQTINRLKSRIYSKSGDFIKSTQFYIQSLQNKIDAILDDDYSYDTETGELKMGSKYPIMRLTYKSLKFEKAQELVNEILEDDDLNLDDLIEMYIHQADIQFLSNSGVDLIYQSREFFQSIIENNHDAVNQDYFGFYHYRILGYVALIEKRIQEAISLFKKSHAFAEKLPGNQKRVSLRNLVYAYVLNSDFLNAQIYLRNLMFEAHHSDITSIHYFLKNS